MKTGEGMEGFPAVHNGTRSLLRQICADLRTGTFDAALVQFIQQFERDLESESRFDIDDFWRYARSLARFPRNRPRVDALVTEKYPNRKIIEFLGRLGLKPQLFAYVSRFKFTHPEAMAQACEYLQMTLFDLHLNVDLGKPSGLRPKKKLNLFRLAQKFRNEHGITRRFSPPDAFDSFEDIIAMERKIASHDAVDFMIQCIILKLVDLRHKDYMYLHATTYPQLETFHSAVMQRGWTKWHMPSTLPSAYRAQFRRIPNIFNQKPGLQDVKNYMKNVDKIELRDSIIFGGSVDEDELSEFLNCLLNNLVRTSRYCVPAFVSVYLSPIVDRLLRGGAFLYVRNPEEKMTSLGALVKFANSRPGDFPLMTLSNFFCCDLRSEGAKASFDNSKPASLTCLAARAVRNRRDNRRLPRLLVPFVEAHQELQSELGAETPPTDCVLDWLRDFLIAVD